MSEQAARVAELRAQGLSLVAVGREVGVSKERVRQIINQSRRETPPPLAFVAGGQPEKISRCEQGYGWPMPEQSVAYDALTSAAMAFADRRARVAGLMQWPRR